VIILQSTVLDTKFTFSQECVFRVCVTFGRFSGKMTHYGN